MYFVDGEYKGSYSNNEDLLAETSGEDNFGLDDYEPLFFHPLQEWVGYGEFSVFLKFDDITDFSNDIFYFCHVSTNGIKPLHDLTTCYDDEMISHRIFVHPIVLL